MKRFTLLAAIGLVSMSLSAQEAKEEPKEEGFVFTTVKELPITSIKNQSRAGTCWCYSSMAFLESELLRMGKGEYDLSEMYIVHQTYLDRADAAVRTHGDVSFSQGGSFYDVLYGMKKFGLVPEEEMRPGVMYGDTLSDDKFTGYEFDYIISNPPFGIDWKREETAVKKENAKGDEGRFAAGLPKISDGQLLFMLNGIKKLKDGTGRMAIIQNGSSLFVGDSGSVAIRKYIIENDLLEAIIQLPTDLFYNTGIATYIWVISKGKEGTPREGKVQLINASDCYIKRRKNIGSKRVDLDDACIELILKAYNEFEKKEYEEDSLKVESKVFDKEFFGYTTVTVETAEKDAKGNYIMKKGKKVAKKGATDSEIVPLTEDIDEFFNKNVLPYNPDAFMDRTKDKIGYEIPFTRLFYKFVAPKSSDEIFAEIKELEAEETSLMKELFGNE